MLLESWREMEIEALKNNYVGCGRDFVAAVEAKFPKRIKVKADLGNDEFELIFPDDEKKIGEWK